MAMSRAFWIAFGAAWAVFALMALGNQMAVVPGVAPGGILDHQVAGTAARVGAIQEAWRGGETWMGVQALFVLDFIFIPLAALAAVLGGVAMLKGGLRALGLAALAGGVISAGTDLTETVAQAMQLWGAGPSDQLAGLAKSMSEPKMAAYVVANGAILAGLVLRRLKS